ncbi:MAG: hypothetical protein KC925_02410 [Candidatus Doudnabacteria bacterium]|nr:hypothetical protein [Candidatus Doudnabacteria bacterium]
MSESVKKEEQMQKTPSSKAKVLGPAALALMLLAAGGVGTASAFQGLDKPTDEQRTQLREAVEAKDYDGWKQLMHSRIDEVSQDEFEQRATQFEERHAQHAERMAEHLRDQGIAEDDIVQLQEYMQNGDFEAANALREELGLPGEDERGHGPHKGHHGMRHGEFEESEDLMEFDEGEENDLDDEDLEEGDDLEDLDSAQIQK